MANGMTKEAEVARAGTPGSVELAGALIKPKAKN